MASYLLLILGLPPFVALIWLYKRFIHPNRNQLWLSFNKLDLPNKVGVGSLVVAVVGFLYTIVYSSVSTFYTLRAVESADISGAEQRAAFNKQVSLMKEQQAIMQRQQTSLEQTLEVLRENVMLAQKQINNLNDINLSSKRGAKISQSQLELSTSLAKRELYNSRLAPDLVVSLITEGHEKAFTQEELDKKTFRVKPGKTNDFASTIYVSNLSPKAAHNVTITIKVSPESVKLYDPRNTINTVFTNRVLVEEFVSYTLTSDRTFPHTFSSIVPPDVDRVVYTVILSCDSPNSTRGFTYNFLVDHSLQNK